MPGFLGSEKKFQAQYGKPILMSRDAKSSSREQEEGKRKRRYFASFVQENYL